MVDEQTGIPPEKMKKQIDNYKDNMRPLDLAPTTKRKMYIKEKNIPEHLFSFPCLEMGSKSILEIFQSNLKYRAADQAIPDIGITLVSIPAENANQQDEPMHLDPILEEAEMERNQNGSDQQPINLDQPGNRTFVEPFLPPPILDAAPETPHENENAPPLAFLNSVLMSPFPNMAVDQAEGGVQGQDILMERNSSTPVGGMMSTPRRSPRKESRGRLSQQDAALEGELDVSRSSRASTTWDVKAQFILSKLRERMNWLRETPEMTFDDVVDGRDTRKSVARKFYALLQLKKSQSVDFKQDEPYGTITIRGGPAFDMSVNAEEH